MVRGVALEVGLNENADEAVIPGTRRRGHDLEEPVARRAVQRHGRALCGTFRLELQSLEPRPYTDTVREPDDRFGNVRLLGFLTRGSRQCAPEREWPERRNIDVQRVGVRGFLGKLEDPHNAASLDGQQPEASGFLDRPAPASGRLHLTSNHRPAARATARSTPSSMRATSPAATRPSGASSPVSRTLRTVLIRTA